MRRAALAVRRARIAGRTLERTRLARPAFEGARGAFVRAVRARLLLQQQRLFALRQTGERRGNFHRRHVVFLFVLLDQLLDSPRPPVPSALVMRCLKRVMR